VVLLQRELAQEDNLNKLALQYGCKVRHPCVLSPAIRGTSRRSLIGGAPVVLPDL
jgi:hypothetical protein